MEQLVSAQLSHDEWFRTSVAEGFASLDRGEFVTQEEVETPLPYLLIDRIER